jgi:hypothetical protein
LIEQRDAGAVPDVVREPVTGTARHVEQMPATEAANDAFEHGNLGREYSSVGYGGCPGASRVSFLILGGSLVVVGEHAVAKTIVHWSNAMVTVAPNTGQTHWESSHAG